MKNFTSNKITNKLTFFFILGLLSILAIIIFSIIAFNSVSAQDGLAGMYALFGLIPVIIIMILDRICVWKFGANKVNKIQFYIAGVLFSLFILNWIRLQLQ